MNKRALILKRTDHVYDREYLAKLGKEVGVDVVPPGSTLTGCGWDAIGHIDDGSATPVPSWALSRLYRGGTVSLLAGVGEAKEWMVSGQRPARERYDRAWADYHDAVKRLREATEDLLNERHPMGAVVQAAADGEVETVGPTSVHGVV